jgi:hypothetical protein
MCLTGLIFDRPYLSFHEAPSYSLSWIFMVHLDLTAFQAARLALKTFQDKKLEAA